MHCSCVYYHAKDYRKMHAPLGQLLTDVGGVGSNFAVMLRVAELSFGEAIHGYGEVEHAIHPTSLEPRRLLGLRWLRKSLARLRGSR